MKNNLKFFVLQAQYFPLLGENFFFFIIFYIVVIFFNKKF